MTGQINYTNGGATTPIVPAQETILTSEREWFEQVSVLEPHDLYQSQLARRFNPFVRDNDLDLTLWTVVSIGGGGGTVSEANQQLTIAGGAIGQWYIRGVTSRPKALFTIPSDGSTLELSVDLVQGGQDDSRAHGREVR